MSGYAPRRERAAGFVRRGRAPYPHPLGFGLLAVFGDTLANGPSVRSKPAYSLRHWSYSAGSTPANRIASAMELAVRRERFDHSKPLHDLARTEFPPGHFPRSADSRQLSAARSYALTPLRNLAGGLSFLNEELSRRSSARIRPPTRPASRPRRTSPSAPRPRSAGRRGRRRRPSRRSGARASR